MTLGEKLKYIRKSKRYSQDDIANSLAISRQSVSKWENNTAIPSLDILEDLSELCNIDISYFLDDTENIDTFLSALYSEKNCNIDNDNFETTQNPSMEINIKSKIENDLESEEEDSENSNNNVSQYPEVERVSFSKDIFNAYMTLAILLASTFATPIGIILGPFFIFKNRNSYMFKKLIYIIGIIAILSNIYSGYQYVSMLLTPTVYEDYGNK